MTFQTPQAETPAQSGLQKEASKRVPEHLPAHLFPPLWVTTEKGGKKAHQISLTNLFCETDKQMEKQN